MFYYCNHCWMASDMEPLPPSAMAPTIAPITVALGFLLFAPVIAPFKAPDTASPASVVTTSWAPLSSHQSDTESLMSS